MGERRLRRRGDLLVLNGERRMSIPEFRHVPAGLIFTAVCGHLSRRVETRVLTVSLREDRLLTAICISQFLLPLSLESLPALASGRRACRGRAIQQCIMPPSSQYPGSRGSKFAGYGYGQGPASPAAGSSPRPLDASLSSFSDRTMDVSMEDLTAGLEGYDVVEPAVPVRHGR